MLFLVLLSIFALGSSSPANDAMLQLVQMSKSLSGGAFKGHFSTQQANASCVPDPVVANPCSPDSCDLAPLIAFPSGPCIAFFARVGASGVADEIENGILTLSSSDLETLYNLTCAEDTCLLAFFDVIETVQAKATCTPALKATAINLPAVFNLICAEKAPSAACSPYIVDALDPASNNVCLTLTNPNEKACCLMRDMQCCYPTMNTTYDLAGKFPSLDFNSASSTCPDVLSYEVCRNPFNPDVFASLTMSLNEFQVPGDLLPLATDLGRIYGVDASAISITLGATTVTNRRRRFATLASSTDIDVSVYVANGTNQEELVAKMNADLPYADMSALSAANGNIGGGDVGVTKTQASVAEPPAPYVSRAYTPSGSVEQFHSWPRAIGTDVIDFENPDEYGQGLASVIGPFLTIGILAFLCLPIVHCIRNSKCDNTCNGKVSKMFYLFMLLLVAVGCFLGFLSSAETGNAIDGFATGLGDLGRLFGRATTNVDAAATFKTSANSQYDLLRVSCASSTKIVGYIDEGKDYNNDMQASLNSFKEAAEPLETNLVDLEDKIAGVNPTREKTTYAALAFALITFTIGGVHELQMMKTGGGFKCTYYIVLGLGMIVMLGAWSTGGINSLLGVVISDICVDPVGLMATNLDATDGSRTEFTNLFYCNVTTEMFANLNAAIDVIPLIALQVTRIKAEQSQNPSVCGANYDTIIAELETAENAFVADAVATFQVFNCPVIAEIFASIIYDSLCTDFPAGAQLYLGASCMVGIFGLFALCVFRKESEEK